MKTKSRSVGRRQAGCFILTVCFLLSSAWLVAAPRFTLSGVLQDEQGNPVPDDNNVPTQLVFYLTEMSEPAIETVDTVADIRRGVFTASVPVSGALLVNDEVWYQLAIDTDRDGIDIDDFFDGRFQIAQVPLAAATTPISQFDVSGGTPRGGSSVDWKPSKLYMREFRTPASGVTFNRMVSPYTTSAEQFVLCNLGVYDSTGALLFSTGPFLGELISSSSPFQYYSIPVQGALEPNTTYYAAFTTTATTLSYQTPDRLPIRPSVRSTVLMDTSNANLPEEVDLMATYTGSNLNFALWLVDEKDAAKTSRQTGLSESGIPVYAPVAGQGPRP